MVMLLLMLTSADFPMEEAEELGGGEGGEEDGFSHHNAREESEIILQPASSASHSRGEVDPVVSEGDCVKVEVAEIRDYQAVLARERNWPWWPGNVSPTTRRRGKNLWREVVFFGEDDRGINTHSYLVSGAHPPSFPLLTKSSSPGESSY